MEQKLACAVAHRGLVDASCSVSRWQHFSAQNDVMVAILKMRHQVENRLRQSLRNAKNVLPNFIPVRLETTELYGFYSTSA